MAEYTPTGTQAGMKQGNGSLGDGGLTGAASHAASGLMAQVKSRASSQVAAQQARAAEGVGTVASALRKAGNELRSHNEGLASYADMAVDELEHISTRIREKSPGEYVTDLEQFARSRPAAFVGGTFLLGLALARFLKSTQPRRPRSYPRYEAGQGGYRGYNGSGSATSGWPESSGTRTPSASTGHAATSTAGRGGPTASPFSTAGAMPNAMAGQGSSATSSSTSATSSAADASDDIKGAGKTATNQDRGTGDRP